MVRRILLTLALLASALSAPGADLSGEMKAVESIRGLTFTAPVEVRRMTRNDFRSFLKRQIEKDSPVPLPDFFDALAALQLIDGGVDPLPRMLDLYQSQVLAFYDPQSHLYYQIIDPPKGLRLPSMAVRLVVLHELTHALQDQRFDAAKRMRTVEKDWDQQLAYQAVLEGEASFVMLAGLAETMGTSLDDLVKGGAVDEALTLTAQSNEGIAADAPRYFVDSMKFPYIDGIRLVSAAYRKGGWDGVSELDRNPPRSTAEVIHPDLYFAHQTPADIDHPSTAIKGAREIIGTTMGEYHWKFLLGQAAAGGWRGDRARVFRLRDGSTSVVIDSLWTDPEAANRFCSAETEFLKSRSIQPVIGQSGSEVHVSYAVPKPAPVLSKERRTQNLEPGIQKGDQPISRF
jgi:hypothetical protein